MQLIYIIYVDLCGHVKLLRLNAYTLPHCWNPIFNAIVIPRWNFSQFSLLYFDIVRYYSVMNRWQYDNPYFIYIFYFLWRGQVKQRSYKRSSLCGSPWSWRQRIRYITMIAMIVVTPCFKTGEILMHFSGTSHRPGHVLKWALYNYINIRRLIHLLDTNVPNIKFF